jgi:hypothetical protein
MRTKVSTLAAAVLVVAVIGTAPIQAEKVLNLRGSGLRIAPAEARGVVASAKGGYHWTLPEDVIGFEVIGRTTANVTKFADGTVRGTWIHHQIFLDQAVTLVVDATCLGIYDGNRAKVGGVIMVSNDPDLPPGLFAWFQAIDNGEGAGADPDQTTFVGIGDEAENEAYCASPDGPRFGPFDVTGNLQVTEN